jgi:hypothetical protein
VGLKFESTAWVLEALKAAIPKGLTIPLPDPDPAWTPLLVDVPFTLMLMDLVVCANAEYVSNSATASRK